MGFAVSTAMFTKKEMKALLRGEVVEVAGKRYRRCPACHYIFRIDGWTGDWHYCDTD